MWTPNGEEEWISVLLGGLLAAYGEGTEGASVPPVASVNCFVKTIPEQLPSPLRARAVHSCSIFSVLDNATSFHGIRLDKKLNVMYKDEATCRTILL